MWSRCTLPKGKPQRERDVAGPSRVVEKALNESFSGANPAKLRWEARWDGRFALEANTSFAVEEVFWAYHERDVVEKFLQAIKGIVELRPVHVYNETHVNAHVFVCVTSVLLLQLLRKNSRRPTSHSARSLRSNASKASRKSS